MSLHPLTNFEMKRHYKMNLTLKAFYSRNNLPKKKDGAQNKAW